MSTAIIRVLKQNLSSALEKGDLEQAGLLLERLHQEDPLSVETRGLELDFLIRSGRRREAQTLADQLLQLFPGSPRIQFLAGQLAYRAKDYRTAVNRFQESYRLCPRWRSQLMLAKSLTQSGDFDQAAALFDLLVADHPQCYRDIAWLHERRQDFARALAAIERYLQDHPHDEWAKSQRARLRAQTMDPQELIDDTQKLLEFGEEVADAMVPQYVEALIRTGKPLELKQFLRDRLSTLTATAARGAAWVCYRYQVYDLAYDLFQATFAEHRDNPKSLNALEFAAGRCGRLSELVQLYSAHAAEEHRLYGRIRTLRRRIQET